MHVYVYIVCIYIYIYIYMYVSYVCIYQKNVLMRVIACTIIIQYNATSTIIYIYIYTHTFSWMIIFLYYRYFLIMYKRVEPNYHPFQTSSFISVCLKSVQLHKHMSQTWNSRNKLFTIWAQFPIPNSTSI